jgi:DNA-binding CsgD family transcriptional regulator
LVLINAASTLWRARRDGAASSPAMRALLAGQPVLAPPAGDIEAVRDDRSKQLSPAERDIVERLARGQTPKQIAFARGVKPETVYDQIGSARRKTGALTNEHLIVLAWRPAT